MSAMCGFRRRLKKTYCLLRPKIFIRQQHIAVFDSAGRITVHFPDRIRNRPHTFIHVVKNKTHWKQETAPDWRAWLVQLLMRRQKTSGRRVFNSWGSRIWAHKPINWWMASETAKSEKKWAERGIHDYPAPLLDSSMDRGTGLITDYNAFWNCVAKFHVRSYRITVFAIPLIFHCISRRIESHKEANNPKWWSTGWNINMLFALIC